MNLCETRTPPSPCFSIEVKVFWHGDVIEEYLNFTDQIPDDDALDWKCPVLDEFQGKAYHYLNWTYSNSYENCLPIITSWQQFKLNKLCQTDSKTLHQYKYKPVKPVLTYASEAWTITKMEGNQIVSFERKILPSILGGLNENNS
ncbi:UNVERIFIED_CONTAM: hypothetical protein NCL1_35282 [Trichonephila clavipes]